jgi:hypothetical protein
MKRETQAPRFPLFLSMADGKVPTFARISAGKLRPDAR